MGEPSANRREFALGFSDSALARPPLPGRARGFAAVEFAKSNLRRYGLDEFIFYFRPQALEAFRVVAFVEHWFSPSLESLT
jgi:hypothetical protein